MVITKDQLVKALQGPLQLAAEQAVAGAFAAQLDGAVKKALYKIAEISKVSLQQAQEFTGQRLESLVNSSQGEILSRSEEHTSELQSLAYLVCRLLLEKKKNVVNRGLLIFTVSRLKLLVIWIVVYLYINRIPQSQISTLMLTIWRLKIEITT